MTSNQSNMAFKETPLYLYSEPDVTLVIGESEVKVHEYVLAPQSEFFKAALHCGLKESRERRITLPEMKPDITFRVLDWLYRAPLLSPFSDNIYFAFSDPSTQKLKDTMRAFDFLQIKGAGRDYCKLVEENLQKIGPDSSDSLNFGHIGNIVIALNEVYMHGGSIAQEPLDWLVRALVRYKDMHICSTLTTFSEAMARVPDPDGRCFRDMSLALVRKLKQGQFK